MYIVDKLVPINSKPQHPAPPPPPLPQTFELLKIGLFKCLTPHPSAEFENRMPLRKTNVPIILLLVYTICKLFHLHSIKFPLHTVKNTANFVATLFGKPIAHKSGIFPLQLVHGSGTKCIPLDKKKGVNLTIQVQIPHFTKVKFKSPTLWKAFR